jgi:hypothetical protein
MRFMRSRLRWLRLPLALAMALGLLLQATQTASAAVPLPPLLAASICHAGGDAPDAPPLSGDRHQHCQLCQFAAPGFLLPPPAPALHMPLRATQPVIAAPPHVLAIAMRPAYASRAPPISGRSQT